MARRAGREGAVLIAFNFGPETRTFEPESTCCCPVIRLAVNGARLEAGLLHLPAWSALIADVGAQGTAP